MENQQPKPTEEIDPEVQLAELSHRLVEINYLLAALNARFNASYKDRYSAEEMLSADAQIESLTVERKSVEAQIALLQKNVE